MVLRRSCLFLDGTAWLGGIMKIGDLAEHYTEPQCWGIIVAIQTFEYEIYWMDGDRTWIRKASVVKKCP